MMQKTGNYEEEIFFSQNFFIMIFFVILFLIKEKEVFMQSTDMSWTPSVINF